MNKVILIGRVSQDIYKYETTSGTPVAKFNIAVQRDYTDSNGQKQADFITCIAYRKTAEIILKYVKKGNLISIEGRLNTNKYFDDKSQKNVYTTEVIIDKFEFLESKNKQEPQSSLTSDIPNKEVNPNLDNDPFSSFAEEQEEMDFNEDDLPF